MDAVKMGWLGKRMEDWREGEVKESEKRFVGEGKWNDQPIQILHPLFTFDSKLKISTDLQYCAEKLQK